MITLIEALNYQCLRNVSQSLDQFQILVGPNASGKSTFFDVVEFVRDLVIYDLPSAVDKRTRNPQNLLFKQEGKKIELAIEAKIPYKIRRKIDTPHRKFVRYEISLKFIQAIQQFEIVDERVLLLDKKISERYSGTSKATNRSNKNSKILSESKSNFTNLITKSRNNTVTFWSESKNIFFDFNFRSKKSALGQLPEDNKLFPTSIWFRNLLLNGGQRIYMNSKTIRNPSPRSKAFALPYDGSNLPWLVRRFRKFDSMRFRFWIEHLQLVVPDLVDILTFERPEDRHCYMIYKFSNGMELPSWMISEGTLKLTALTLPAYYQVLQRTGIFIVEEPENGIHPSAIDAVFTSLSSMYNSQVLFTTHSPAIVSLANLEDLLCFTRDKDNSTSVIPASKIPMVVNWEDRPNLGWLLSSGVLG